MGYGYHGVRACLTQYSDFSRLEKDATTNLKAIQIRFGLLSLQAMLPSLDK